MNLKLPLLLACCSITITGMAQEARRLSFDFSDAKLIDGYYIEKVSLDGKSLPKLKTISQDFIAGEGPDSLVKGNAAPTIVIGTERKKNFAMLRIPAYRKNEQGHIEKLKHAEFDITEHKMAQPLAESQSKIMRTTANSSVLANGTWQKIAVPARGIYKVDYDFVKNTLRQTGNISSNTIRLFGNGGTMIQESNKIARPDDLTENAIQMYDGGDGVFGAGDYFLFYANGPLDWEKDSVNQRFSHRTNLYADSSYYFITFNNGTGLRMSGAPTAAAPTTFVTSFNEYALHEKELVNLGLFGKTWWGETFGFTTGYNAKQTFSITLPNISDSVYYSYRLASAAIGKDNSARCDVSLNGNLIGSHEDIYGITGVDGENPGVDVFRSGLAVLPSSGTLNFTIDYQKNVTIAKAYLDFIEVNTRRQLLLSSGTQLSFRDWRSVGSASVAQFQLSGANGSTKVWDVTNPLRPQYIDGTLSGSTFSFSRDASVLHEYIAADNNYMTPAFSGSIANQDLHSLGAADYIIVSHPDFLGAANKLADFHKNTNGFRVVTASVDQIYNEFGSGAKDISAIRDFIKMFYDRAGNDENNIPKYLLLLGQASYDYKTIISKTPKIVPTFETPESLSATSGYCSDDFYAILDSNEYIEEGRPLMDIGIGRIPATNAEQAMAVIDKIIRYKSKEALGPWRINNIFIGDREDQAGDHLLDADAMYKTVEGASNIYKAQKVYLDNMNIVSTPGGARCPDANKMINDNIYKGTFLINYSGHGSIYTLSSKRIVTQDDYNSWNNQYKLPIMITATCDFSRFDNPALPSAGEKIMLKGNGGAIALVTTTQVVYANPNHIFNKAYLNAQFNKQAHGWYTFGDAFRISKNEVVAAGDISNSRKFALLGDPAIIPDFPRFDVHTDSVQEMIEGTAVSVDSVKSLGRYIVHGSVRNDDGFVMNDFNGKVTIAFFDKAQEISVKTQTSGNSSRKYNLQNNIIYKGIATVESGKFSFEFITPKDINYEFGKGKISYYAENGMTDASGADTAFTVGGFSDHAIADEDAPLVRPFMNDSLFKDGGLTGNNTVLYAIITDNSGINVSGNFVGHDLTAVLDETVEVPYILNDYYETAPNTYQKGYVNFPMTGLSNGIHTIRVKAWDVFNNSGEGTIHFEVLNGEVVKLRNLYTYPNPFRDLTHFVFEHNHPNEALKATINIYNTTGALIRTIEQNFTATGSNSAEVSWDGTGNGGEKLMPGIYPYRIRIATEKNIEDLGYQKVVLQR
jgi:hypothetical protein